MSEVSDVKIRTALENDLPYILDIINDSIETSTADYRYDTINATDLKVWYKNHIANNEPVLVAEIGDVIVGYATYGQFRERIGFQYSVEHSIYCHNDYKGKGIGKLLMNELIAHAKNSKSHTMVACIDAENHSSIKFHEKLGFMNVGQMKQIGFKFNRFLDMAIMQLMLQK